MKHWIKCDKSFANLGNLVNIQLLQWIPTTPANLSSFAFVNCCSIVNNAPHLQYELCNRKVDLCGLAKTWIKDDDPITSSLVPPNGYKIVSYQRPYCQGGGFALVSANRLDLIKSTKYTFHTIECADFSIKHKGETLHIMSIYRPPDTSILSFDEKFANLIEMNHGRYDHPHEW